MAIALGRRDIARVAFRDKRARTERSLPSFDPVRLSSFGLTRRELSVLELVAAGDTNEQVASSLGISPLTVKKHLERMSEKLQATNRAALVARAWRSHADSPDSTRAGERYLSDPWGRGRTDRSC